MIRMIQSKTATQAKDYFDAALAKADYYTQDQELEGYFHGKIATRLGMSGLQADRRMFHALCDNINPQTGRQLNPRNKSDKTVGYDINFHCPKSVSLLHVLSGDDRILEVFRNTVNATMFEIEKDIKTRVRISNKQENRHTGELIYAEFVHQTARPVDGQLPDPHLHAHCFVFNTTYDPVEQRFKAGQFRDIKRDMPYYQAVFQKMLADNISNLGYDIEKTPKAFEVKQINKDVVRLFSKRTNEIGQFAKEKGITDPKALDQLGARTRAKKVKGHSMFELIEGWKHQVKNQGHEVLENISPQTKEKQSIDQCLDHAIEHSFERASVVAERRLLAKAYHQAIDRPALTIGGIDKAYREDQRLFKVNDGYQTLVTTRSVQWEEKRMLELAKDGRGKLTPLKIFDDNAIYDGLNREQSNAVKHVLSSPDRVTFIRGGAGTGKTTLTKTAVKEFNNVGRNVFLFAPTAEASRGVLRAEGFDNADTVKKLLSDKPLQQEIKGQVLWIDEAGLLGTKDMADILSLAKDQNARVVLSGDSRQHTAVQRGDALRILQKMGGISPASVNRIYRQKGIEYRKAVDDISQGNIEAGFNRLDKMGAIKELEGDQLADQLVKDYLQCLKDRKSALVISPTNEQSGIVTDKIRQALKENGLIAKRDKHFKTYRNLYLTEAEKSDPRNFEEGHVIQFHQNTKGIQRGAKCHVHSIKDDRISIKDREGKIHSLDTTKTGRFDVYREQETLVSKGDLISITKNGFDINRGRLNNGALFEVKSIDKQGTMTVMNPSGKGREYMIDQEFGNFRHAYCMTSYSSQGKTVDRVFISQPAGTFPATSQKQFYVSVSRGRESVKIYTDDKNELLDHARYHGDRLSASELAQIDHRINRIAPEQDRTIKPDKDHGIEPTL